MIKEFRDKLIIGDKSFRFYEDLELSDKEYNIYPKSQGYGLIIAKDDAHTIIFKKGKLSLDALNKLLPQNFQFTKDDIIFALVADSMES